MGHLSHQPRASRSTFRLATPWCCSSPRKRHACKWGRVSSSSLFPVLSQPFEMLLCFYWGLLNHYRYGTIADAGATGATVKITSSADAAFEAYSYEVRELEDAALLFFPFLSSFPHDALRIYICSVPLTSRRGYNRARSFFFTVGCNCNKPRPGCITLYETNFTMLWHFGSFFFFSSRGH